MDFVSKVISLVKTVMLCVMAVSCNEPKAGEINYQYGSKDNAKLLLETGRNMTLSFHSTRFETVVWKLPKCGNLSCGQRVGSTSVRCEAGQSHLTITDLTMYDGGNYECKCSANNVFAFIVDVIGVSMSASVDDGCEEVNFMAHLDSNKYFIESMISPSFIENRRIFRHHRQFYSITKSIGEGDFKSHQLNLTIRKGKNDTRYHLIKSVTLDKQEHCNKVKSPTSVRPESYRHVGNSSSRNYFHLTFPICICALVMFISHNYAND